MSETAYETLPELEPAQPKASTGTLVMKFGGTSVADPEKIRGVAERLVETKRAGSRVVAVVSAMGRQTDELLALAHDVSPTPKPRELDMLTSVGERISCALVAMAISDLGLDAIHSEISLSSHATLGAFPCPSTMLLGNWPARCQFHNVTSLTPISLHTSRFDSSFSAISPLTPHRTT